MTKVIMNGCNGKMGQTITEICKADADIEIVAGIDLYDGIDNDYPVFSSIDKCDVDADVVIDFSNAKAVDGVLDYCMDAGVRRTAPRTARFDGFVKHRNPSSIISYRILAT